MSQRSIPSSRVSRAVALAKTGARVGGNYLRYYGRKGAGVSDARDQLHEANAKDTFDAFSKLKGGPLKVAQMLSIDQNILPSAYVREFSKAQYSAPPLSYPLVVQTFRRAFGKAPHEIFDTFTREAVNAASIGQVHRATKDGRTYAVKVQYPGVADSLLSDLRLLKPFAARLFNLRSGEMEHFFSEVQERLLEETNYALELRRSIALSEASRDLPHTLFPGYYPEFSSDRIITMDWIEGLPLDRFAESGPAPELRDRIGQAIWNFYHFQVHELREFHADPHPGNFLVTPDHRLCVLDFGCVKALPEPFYLAYFQLLAPGRFDDPKEMQAVLEDLGLLLPTDSPRERALLVDVFTRSIELLSRPFQSETFDFGDPDYMRAIYEFGENNRLDKELEKVDNARGSPHAIYLNRAYFGLYSIMARLGATIRAKLPAHLRPLDERKAATA
ncbi:MAG: ABC1 kinase family protein [Opitutales bacterium]